MSLDRHQTLLEFRGARCNFSAPMQLRFLLAAALALLSGPINAAPNEQGKAEHVVLVVWDGMRPDLVTPQHAPTLAALTREGVFFRNHHAIFPSSTNVNGAGLATGVSPEHNGVISNQEFRPEVDLHKPFDTSDFTALDFNDQLNKHLIAVPTIAELVQQAGFRTAIAGAKPVAQFFDRSRHRETTAARESLVLYRGKVLPPSAATLITAALGPFPKRKWFPNEEEDGWTTRVLTEVLWKESIPKFSLLWLSEPDLSQHETAPGSPTSLAAIKSSDDNLAKVLAALKAKNALTNTDILIVSDHGFSTIDLALDAAGRLRAAGFDAVRKFPSEAKSGQVLVVSLGGSMEFYVAGHDAGTVRRLVDYLQHSDFAGVIVTRVPEEGAFNLAQFCMETPEAPDVFVSSRWNDRPNEFGIRGLVPSDLGKGLGQGTHTTLSPFDLHNTLVASGLDFRRGWNDETPSGNIDIAPTILHLLGLKPPQPLDGRILREALRNSPNESPVAREQTLHARREDWAQYLRLTTVDGSRYFLEGNGGRVATGP